jgi:hypothetical protein
MLKMGQQGFYWFVGIVEDNTTDDMKLGGCKVRVFGVHEDLPTDRLPDAIVMMPTTSGSFQGIGDTPGLLAGSFVFGFFLDGSAKRYPMIIGTMPYLPGENENNHSIPSLAREIQSVVNNKVGNEPDSSYAAKYPYNRAIVTRAGHIVEIDDTPDNERLHIRHSKGSYVEINKDGRMIIKSVDDSFEIVGKDKNIHIEGNANIKVKGNMNSIVDGKTTITGKNDIVLASEGRVNINGVLGVNISSGTSINIESPGGLIQTEGSFTTIGTVSMATGVTDTFSTPSGKTVHVNKGVVTKIG